MAGKLRKTKQKEMLGKVLDGFKGFFTAEELYAAAKKKDGDLGIATVYRYLKGLSGSGNIYQHVCGKTSLYSRENNSHCHFVCENTGEVIHFKVEDLDFLKKIRQQIPGSINSFQLEIKGVCERCKD